MKIAYLGYQDQKKYLLGTANDENQELLDFLKGKGLNLDFVVWNDPKVDWKAYDAGILKSPWDYHEDIQGFHHWLDRMQALGIPLLNPPDLVRWNSDKHYLQAIADAGLSVVPFVYAEKNIPLTTIDPYFDLWHTSQVVVKPCVSAGAKNTYLLKQGQTEQALARINPLLTVESYLIQPFEQAIVNGEWSFVFFNQQYSHSVLKIPGKNDFRVQHYLGGQITSPTAKAQHIEQAAQYVRQFAKGSLYARVDGLIKDEQFHLMELELIEPYLYLHSEKERFEKYYQAFLAVMHL